MNVVSLEKPLQFNPAASIVLTGFSCVSTTCCFLCPLLLMLFIF